MPKKHLFDTTADIKRLLVVFFCICITLLGVELFIDKSEAHFAWEKWPAFYNVFGFLSGVALVMLAKYLLRPLVKRDEDYYD